MVETHYNARISIETAQKIADLVAEDLAGENETFELDMTEEEISKRVMEITAVDQVKILQDSVIGKGEK